MEWWGLAFTNLPENFIGKVNFFCTESIQVQIAPLAGRRKGNYRQTWYNPVAVVWVLQTNTASSQAVKMEIKSGVAPVELDFRALVGRCSY